MRKIIIEHHWLNIVVSISLAGSIAGIVAGAITNQVLFIATPLTIAVGLNILNQQRMNCLKQQQINYLQKLIQRNTQQKDTSYQFIEPSHDKIKELNQRVNQIETLFHSSSESFSQQIQDLKETNVYFDKSIAQLDERQNHLELLPKLYEQTQHSIKEFAYNLEALILNPVLIPS